jgi:prepilin-type N-terminal cleavage/methylation domain-containing protein
MAAMNLSRIRSQTGVTLMELMVVVAIVGILSVVGWAQYQDQLNRGIRGDAVTALNQAAAEMERCYSRTVPNSYADCSLPNQGVGRCSDSNLKKGNTIIYSPKCQWQLSISQQSANAYTLRADRSYEVADGSTKSETLTLDSLGRKIGPWPQ